MPYSYAILFFTTLDFTSITSHIHSWMLLWLHLVILSGYISPLFSSSILGTYWPGEFIFQCPVFCLFILFMGFSRQEYWSGLPFPSTVDHFLSKLPTTTHPSWVTPHSMAHSFRVRQGCGPFFSDYYFLWLLFSFCLLSWGIRIRGLWKLPNGRDWLWGKLGLVLMGGAMLSKSLTQFSVDDQGCVPSLLLTWDQTMVEVMEIMATFFRRPCTHTATLSAPDPAAGTTDPHRCQRLLDTHRYLLVSGSWGKSSQSVINH